MVYSDKQSDIWSAVGKAAAGGLGVGAALGGVATAAVAAPAITAVAAGVWLILNFKLVLSLVLCCFCRTTLRRSALEGMRTNS